MLLLGNALSFVGCFLMIAIGFIKNKDRILTAQCIQFGFQGAGHLALGAVTGFVSCIFCIVRILVFQRVRATAWLKIGFIAAQAVMTGLTGAQTLIDWLPVLSVVAYTWFLDTDDAVVFKLANMTGTCMWVAYDLHYRNYAAFGFDILTLVSTAIGIVLVLRERKKESGNP